MITASTIESVSDDETSKDSDDETLQDTEKKPVDKGNVHAKPRQYNLGDYL